MGMGFVVGNDLADNMHRSAHILISIHAPHTGSDKSARLRRYPDYNFNPRSPHGERLDGNAEIQVNDIISIHAPHTGSDVNNLQFKT